MMEELFNWSLKASGLLIILFAAYYFLFRNNTEFQVRRVLLLVLVVLCAVAPFMEFSLSSNQPVIVQKALDSKQFLYEQIESSTQPAALVSVADLPKQSKWDWVQTIHWVYISGIGLSLIILLFELIKVFYWKWTATREVELGQNILSHPSIQSPFSFWKWVFIPTHEKYSPSTWSIVAKHELAHIERKHTLDLLLARLFQSVLWFNPIIYLFQKELKSIHEAQADEQVLKSFQLSTYAQALMQISLKDQQIQIAHSFAVISSFSKRLKLMKTHKTKLKRTLTLITLFSIFAVGILGWTTVRGQDSKKGEITVEQINPKITDLMSFTFEIGIIRKLSAEHSNAYNKLKEENPDKSISYQYFQSNDFSKYFDSYEPGYRPIYIDEVTEEQKLDLYQKFKNDTSRLSISLNDNGTREPKFYTYAETVPDLRNIIAENANYLMIYEATPIRIFYEETILEPNEVDKLPEVIGGIENLAKSIALNLTIPEELDRAKLPETVDFSFVVRGGNSISHLDLLTELKGSEKKNAPYYKFFGTIHNTLKSKVSTLYPWKRGIKNGKEVLVRMKISIPTKYMM